MELSSTMKRFLTQANSSWEKEAEKAKQNNFDNLDDGQYICRLTDYGLSESSSGRPAAVGSYTVLEGEHRGETFDHWRMLDGDDGLSWFGRELLVFGVDLEDVIWDPKQSKDDAFVENVLSAIAAERPAVKVTVKNGFKNPRQVIDDYEGEDPEPAEEPKSSKKGASTAAAPKKGGKKKADPEPEPEESEEESEEETAEEEGEGLAVGMKVRFTFKGETMDGQVIEIMNEEGVDKARIKTDGGIKKVKFENIEGILDAELDEEE